MLLPPILEWLVSTAKGWRDSVFCVTAALLMLPKHFYFPRQGDAASISCIISPMLLLAMSLVLWPTSTEIAKFRESYREMRGAFGRLDLRVGGSRSCLAGREMLSVDRVCYDSSEMAGLILYQEKAG